MLVKNFRGKSLTKGGLAFSGIVTWDLILNIEEQPEDETFIETDGSILTVFFDWEMLEKYCTYQYIEEFDVYLSNQVDKMEQVIRIIDIERQEFFDLRSIKPIFGDNEFLMSIDIEEDGKMKNYVKDYRVRFWDFPNSVEEIEQIFPECYNDVMDTRYTMTLSKDKEFKDIISRTIME